VITILHRTFPFTLRYCVRHIPGSMLPLLRLD